MRLDRVLRAGLWRRRPDGMYVNERTGRVVSEEFLREVLSLLPEDWGATSHELTLKTKRTRGLVIDALNLLEAAGLAEKRLRMTRRDGRKPYEWRLKK